MFTKHMMLFVLPLDEDIEAETESYRKEIDAISRPSHIDREHHDSASNPQAVTASDEAKRLKRRHERRAKRDKASKTLTNLLFSNEQELNEMSSDTESGAETEEELEIVPEKRLKETASVSLNTFGPAN